MRGRADTIGRRGRIAILPRSKLRERQREKWAADLARRESAETDEIGMQITHFLSAADDAAAPEPIQPQVP